MKQNELSFGKAWVLPVLIGFATMLIRRVVDPFLVLIASVICTVLGKAIIISQESAMVMMGILVLLLWLLLITICTQFMTAYDQSGRCRARAQRSYGIIAIVFIAFACIVMNTMPVLNFSFVVQAALILACLTGRLRLPIKRSPNKEEKQ